jgi:D-sedoheptulose 7-phosphate isomerase
MEKGTFISNYFEHFRRVAFDNSITPILIDLSNLFKATNIKGKKVIFAGNGASATIASHCALDFTKQAGIRAISFNEPAIITAYGNDYGYEQWIAKALEHYADPGDLTCLISSSGTSINLINGAKHAKEAGLQLITFSGFERNNPLKQLGDVNLWADSKSYNTVETTHMLWLVALCDLIIGKREYSVTEN